MQLFPPKKFSQVFCVVLCSFFLSLRASECSCALCALYAGEVYTFGKYGEGQLGRSAPSEGSGGKGERRQDNEAWHLSPSPIPSLGDGCKVVWVGAGGNQTFIAVDESLVSDQNLSKCHVFADSQTIGEWSSCSASK